MKKPSVPYRATDALKFSSLDVTCRLEEVAKMMRVEMETLEMDARAKACALPLYYRMH